MKRRLLRRRGSRTAWLRLCAAFRARCGVWGSGCLGLGRCWTLREALKVMDLGGSDLAEIGIGIADPSSHDLTACLHHVPRDVPTQMDHDQTPGERT